MKNLRSLQNVQLDILKSIIKVIEDNKLTYVAVGGTALGAFRHNGIIPWDDDIDIAMPRVDYQKFIQLHQQLPDDLFIQNFESDENYPLYFTKVRKAGTKFVEQRFQNQAMHQGIFVDIFPLDNIAPNSERVKSIKHKENAFRRLVKNSFKKHFYRLIYGMKSSQQLYKEVDTLIQQNNNKKADYYGSVQANDYFPAADLQQVQRLAFEDIEINVVANIEKYLEIKYGDYMRIPKPHERRTHNVVLLDLGNDKREHISDE